MIPTMIGFGLVLGWWWRPALVAAALVWPGLLLATGVFELSWRLPLQLLGAALLGVANAAVGVVVAQALRRLLRRRARAAG